MSKNEPPLVFGTRISFNSFFQNLGIGAMAYISDPTLFDVPTFLAAIGFVKSV